MSKKRKQIIEEMQTEYDHWHQVTEVMIVYGGNFAKTLAGLYRIGDSYHQKRLREAFPEIWEEYQKKCNWLD